MTGIGPPSHQRFRSGRNYSWRTQKCQDVRCLQFLLRSGHGALVDDKDLGTLNGTMFQIN